MKKIVVAFFCLLSLSMLFASSELAYSEGGKSVILNSDGTWEESPQNNISIPPNTPTEELLYKYAATDQDDVLLDEYLKYYRGKDLAHTQIIECYRIERYNGFYDIPDKKLESLFPEAIADVYAYGKIFEIPYEYNATHSSISNLMFFWNYAKYLEARKEYSEALSYVKQMKELFTKTGSKYKFTYSDNNEDSIDLFIYKLSLKCSTDSPSN